MMVRIMSDSKRMKEKVHFHVSRLVGESIMNIKELREKAIKSYKNGKSPKEIYQSLDKDKSWFFK